VEALFSKPMACWGTEITKNLQAKPSGFSQQDGDCGLSVVKQKSLDSDKQEAAAKS